jgi:nicotinate-nucleotide pyrophosphorylase (carboxylating)
MHDFHQIEWDATVEDDLRQIVRLAVREDLGRQNDWTTVALVGPEERGRADVVVRKAGVVCGLRALPVVFHEMQAAIACELRASDGDRVEANSVVAELVGSARDLLTCERTLLNVVGRLSGITTLTRQHADALAGTRARLYDTRKTTPGWRRLEKYAARCGGGYNHRTGLFDAILIKDNHLAVAAAGHLSPADAVRRAREFLEQAAAEGLSPAMLIEVEVDSLAQLDDVLAAGPDVVLLDNMTLEAIREAVTRRDALAPAVELEASGGVTLETIREIASTGIERISAGGLTHSACWLDVALDWRRE